MSFFPHTLRQRAEDLLQRMQAERVTLATAESCTGGLLSALITEIAGSSAVFTHGFVTYANEAKSDLLNIPAPMIAIYGAVSEEVAMAMAREAQKKSGATIAVAITGIAGPGGATPTKPVGRVHIACARRDCTTLHQKFLFSGDRSAVRLQAVAAALDMVQQQMGQ
jgi:nicotinamide-nucleotide amidase